MLSPSFTARVIPYFAPSQIDVAIYHANFPVVGFGFVQQIFD